MGHLRRVRRLPPGADEIIVTAVAKHVKHPSSNGRDNFLRNLSIAMRGIGSDGCIEAMVMIIQSDLPPDAEDIFRHEVVSDLGEMSEPGAEEALLELAKDKSSPIYWSTIRGLARHHNQTALKPLLTLIQSGDERKRASAARALWGLRDLPEAKAALEDALKDPDPEVRMMAKHALTSERFNLFPPF